MMMTNDDDEVMEDFDDTMLMVRYDADTDGYLLVVIFTRRASYAKLTIGWQHSPCLSISWEPAGRDLKPAARRNPRSERHRYSMYP